MERQGTRIVFTSRRAFSYILYFFIALPFFWPEYFNETGTLQLLEQLLTYFSLGLMVYKILNGKIRKENGFPMLILVVEYLILVVSTYANNGELITTINTSIKKLCFFLVIGKAIADKEEITSLLSAIRDITVALFAINIISEIMFPKGIPGLSVSDMTPHFFLGNVNKVIRVVFPGLCASVLLSNIQNRKISKAILFFYIGFIYQSLFRYTSATTIIALAVLVLWFVFSGFINEHIRTIYIAVCGVVAYIEFSLVVLSSNAFLTNFLTSVFGKTISFSGRTFIWARTLLQIVNKPLFGYGVQNAERMQYMILNPFSAHNYFLDLSLQRGIVGMAIFLLLIILPITVLKNGRRISKYAYTLLGFSCVVYYMYLFEPFYSTEAIIIPIIYCTFVILFREHRNSKEANSIW